MRHFGTPAVLRRACHPPFFVMCIEIEDRKHAATTVTAIFQGKDRARAADDVDWTRRGDVDQAVRRADGHSGIADLPAVCPVGRRVRGGRSEAAQPLEAVVQRRRIAGGVPPRDHGAQPPADLARVYAAAADELSGALPALRQPGRYDLPLSSLAGRAHGRVAGAGRGATG